MREETRVHDRRGDWDALWYELPSRESPHLVGLSYQGQLHLAMLTAQVAASLCSWILKKLINLASPHAPAPLSWQGGGGVGFDAQDFRGL